MFRGEEEDQGNFRFLYWIRKVKIIASNKFDSQTYNKSIFKTTHNSYQWSLTKQLKKGIRGFELDIHDFELLVDTRGWDNFLDKFPGKKPPHYFKIGHAWPGHEVNKKLLSGNPRGNNLEDWLRKIADWSRDKKNKGHAPITVFLDIKKNLIDDKNNPPEVYGLKRFNEQIRDACGDRLVTPENFDAGLPIKKLRDKIIVVLMSFHTASRKLREARLEYEARLEKQKKQKPMFLIRVYEKVRNFIKKQHQVVIEPTGAMQTRIAYQEGSIDKPICHVAFNPEDQDQGEYDNSLDDAVFVTAYDGKYSSYQAKGKVVRTDYEGSLENINFPATDHWKDKGYQDATTKWVE